MGGRGGTLLLLECCLMFRGQRRMRGGSFLAYMFIDPRKIHVHRVWITYIKMRDIEHVIHDFFTANDTSRLSSILHARRHAGSDGASICRVVPSATISVGDG